MSTRAAIFVLTMLLSVGVTYGAGRPGGIEGCYPLTLDDALTFEVPRFEDYPARSIFKGLPVPPDVRSPARAKRYRAMLRLGAERGPNFAGHYTVVGWGCGAGCVEFAIVDAQSGRVRFPDDMRYVDTNLVSLSPEETEPEFIGLRYRLDSRLLVVVGAPDEKLSRTGITYYLWTGAALRKLGFIPSHKQVCPETPGKAGGPAGQGSSQDRPQAAGR